MASTKRYQQYLQEYCEPEIRVINQEDLLRTYDAICVIPIFDEPIDNLARFLSHQTEKRIAYVWVFNCPHGAEEESVNRTVGALGYFCEAGPQTSLTEHISRIEITSQVDLYLIDRCFQGDPIPRKQGVGLARKIGLDLALRLVAVEHWQSTWLHSCDADVELPRSYFDIPSPIKGQVVALYPFKHIAEEGYERAMALYDLKLHYYRNQLTKAGSPYAYYTIGSTITVTPDAYVQVRGMPKRAGGEDFYFLNKLAKLGDVIQLDQPILRVAGRPSLRVPFGTGPALVDIVSLEDSERDYRYYHPEIFVALKGLLATIRDVDCFQSTDEFYKQLNVSISADLSEQVRDVLDSLGFEKQFSHFYHRDASQISGRFHTWFDAFKTLKFVHSMRDKFYPSLSLEDLPEHVKVNANFGDRVEP